MPYHSMTFTHLCAADSDFSSLSGRKITQVVAYYLHISCVEHTVGGVRRGGAML